MKELISNDISLQAAEKLKITAKELCKLQIADGVIPVILNSFLFLAVHVKIFIIGSKLSPAYS